MGSKLWKVSYKVKYDGGEEKRDRYAIGYTANEAIQNARPFVTKLYECTDFMAEEINTGAGEVYLWLVNGSTYNSSFSGFTSLGPFIVPGRSSIEAERRAMALCDNDACNFTAIKVTEVQGYNVTVTESNNARGVMNAAALMGGN